MGKTLFLFFIITTGCLSMGKYYSFFLEDSSEKSNKEITPGIAVSVIKNGREVYTKSYGYSNFKTGNLISSDTNFRLASLSKQFTAMCLAILEEKGVINSDDYISKYIPEMPEYTRKIRVKHLVYHTSGLPDYMELYDFDNRENPYKEYVTNNDIIKLLKIKRKLLFIPGEKFLYSNTGYAVLAVLIERASGTSFPEFIEKEIFNKIGMNKSIVPLSDVTPVEKQAVSYDGWPHFKPNIEDPCNYIYGDGTVYSSVNDMIKWFRAIDTNKLISHKEKIFEPGRLNNGKKISYAYGWSIDEYNGEKIISHEGSWLAFNTIDIYIPERRLWILVLTNSSKIEPDIIAEKLITRFE